MDPQGKYCVDSEGSLGWAINLDMGRYWKAIALVKTNTEGSKQVTEDEAEEYAKRIVAAMNAVAGIPTEDLVGVTNLAQSHRQRLDMLAKAAKHTAEEMNAVDMDS